MLFEIEHCVLSCWKTKSRILRFDPEIEIWPLAVCCFHPICAVSCNGPLNLLGESVAQKSAASGALSTTSISAGCEEALPTSAGSLDRKSTRLNSSHPSISYAVFCL